MAKLIQNSDSDNPREFYEAILSLRLLLLRKSDTKAFDIADTLMDHTEVTRMKILEVRLKRIEILNAFSFNMSSSLVEPTLITGPEPTLL